MIENFKIIAQRGENTYLLSLGNGLGSVLELQERGLYPPKKVPGTIQKNGWCLALF